MTILDAIARVGQIEFPRDLTAEVPSAAFLAGLRAAWHSSLTADADGRGVVAVADVHGRAIVDAFADTVADAREWLAEQDWTELAEWADGRPEGLMDHGEALFTQREAN